MQPKSGVLVVAMLAVLLSTLAVPDARAALKISGKIEDTAGEPRPGTQVILTPVDAEGNPTGEAVIRVEANKKGSYVFGFAKPGAYLLSVDAGELQLLSATVKMRSAERKPVYGPDGAIEDQTAAVDPAKPVLFLGIPRDAFFVEADLTVGKPKPVAPSAAQGSMERDILDSGLGAEVDAILASIEAKQYEAALTEADGLLAENPELAPLWYVKGFTLVKLVRLPEAEVALREALRIDPKIKGAAGLLGQILGQQGKYEEAAVVLRQELSATTEPAARGRLLLGLGQALLETGKLDEAIAALEEAHGIFPDDPVTRVQLTDAYVRAGKNQEAEALMGGDMDPQAASVLHYNVATNMLRAEKWAEAADHLRQALALNPDLHVCHRYLGEAYLAQGKRDEAIKELEAYLKAAPDAEDAADARSLLEALKKSR